MKTIWKYVEMLKPSSVVDWALIALALWFFYQVLTAGA